MLMYKSILMNLEVFPIFIFSPPNLTLKIPKIAMKNFFGALLWSKIVLFFHHHCQDTDKKNFWLIITCQKLLFWEKFLENRPFNSQRILPYLRNLPYRWFCTWAALTKTDSEKGTIKRASSVGIEPTTSRLTVERANRLRHEDLQHESSFTS